MKFPASDKLEIIRLVEASHLGVKQTLEKIGVSKSTFYRWYDLYARFGEQGLEDRRAGPGRVWNRIRAASALANFGIGASLKRLSLHFRKTANATPQIRRMRLHDNSADLSVRDSCARQSRQMARAVSAEGP